MNKKFGLAMALAAAFTLVSPSVRAQNVVEGASPLARTIYVFNAGPGLGANKLATWGNGEANNSEQWTYNDDSTLKIRSRNFYEGARFDLAQPLDITPYKKDGFVRMRVHFKVPGMMMEEPPADAAGALGGAAPRAKDTRIFSLPPALRSPETRVTTMSAAQTGTMKLPRAPRRKPAFGAGGPGDAPELVGGGGVAEAPQQMTPVTQIRVVFLHDKGATSGSVAVDLEAITEDDNGWRTLVFPVRDMRATPNVQGPVRRVLVSSDADDSFWLAQMALVSENGKMTASVRRASDEVGAQIADITTKPGPLKLVADVESGIADAIIEWNFDADNVGNLPPAAFNPQGEGAIAGGEGDAKVAVAGPRIDALGLQATYDYPNEEQNYRVEVTVRDRSGRKAAVKASILVRVRG